MAKQRFRAVDPSQPRYPRPADLKGQGLRDLGLVAVGSLLLGNLTCASRSELRTDPGKPTASDQGGTGGQTGQGGAGDQGGQGDQGGTTGGPVNLPPPGVPPLPHDPDPVPTPPSNPSEPSKK